MTPTSNEDRQRGTGPGEDDATEFEISVETLKRRLDSGESIQIVDVREVFEYRTANIGGLLIPLHELPDRISELDKEKELILMCHHGQRSARATEFLRRKGFRFARNLAGGIDAWSLHIDATVPRY